MATATQLVGTAVNEADLPSVHPDSDRRIHRCQCGHVLSVSGGGRHRVFFELGDARRDDPIINRVCPACGHGLPGKNRP